MRKRKKRQYKNKSIIDNALNYVDENEDRIDDYLREFIQNGSEDDDNTVESSMNSSNCEDINTGDNKRKSKEI